jgi:hypothetical protein
VGVVISKNLCDVIAQKWMRHEQVKQLKINNMRNKNSAFSTNVISFEITEFIP